MHTQAGFRAITSGRTFSRLHNLRLIESAQSLTLYKDIKLRKLLLNCSDCERIKKKKSLDKTVNTESRDWDLRPDNSSVDEDKFFYSQRVAPIFLT